MTIVTGRLAPSPTGAQHVGNARTYLIAWLSARAAGGNVRLRIEDIDVWRNKPGAADEAIDDLRWLGLDWVGDPVFQSARLPAHVAALERLKALELVYPCTCTRADIAAAASAPHAEHEGPTYPRTCAVRRADDVASLTVPYTWRFRVNDSPAFVDGYGGETRVDLNRAGGDFIVWRSADVPAYQLAVVVDDAEAGVTEVVRGDDLISSTPRQILLYRALGLPVPRFVHVPLVVGADGRRLAKRHGDTRLSALRATGVRPEAVVGLLAWSCGWRRDMEPISAAELVPLFDLQAIPREPFVLTAELLQAIGFESDQFRG
ncbi:tRNA glutamyl-Q(34) synthetase GluQRS [Fimbriiglobus ruber]|uniref:Glutamyl-Q tRNA(Asp) synthetase n=1 Tax=Fimbriiglobus ruber TaxID=1908690 RepID=A0A225E2Z1_9BACT|nr:tRNA glutamyl-Q(34) synthetase GluQRS [Fimbriiglobus ruber]OWK43849.1 glutamyl-Q-tRNA synthetase [Fimbriiglobus ruber]